MVAPLTITIPPLVNPHCHLREGDVLGPCVVLAIRGGTIVLGFMPNTKLGLKNAQEVLAYMKSVKAVVEQTNPGWNVVIIPIGMLTPQTTEADLDAFVEAGIMDLKVYPLNRTTKSHNGVREYSPLVGVIRYAGKRGMRVHFHPEHPYLTIINRDAEYLFIPIMDMLFNQTDTTIVWEHGTDHRCIPFWEQWGQSGRFYVTLTAHHLATHEDEVFGDVRAVCKPPIKTVYDARCLVELIAKGYRWVMAGLDDAPHDRDEGKHVHEGCCACGAYTAPFGLQLYAHSLLRGRIGRDIFVNFTSGNAQKLYGLEDTGERLVLVNKPFKIPLSYEIGSWVVEPFWAGRTIDWSIETAA